MTMTTEIIENFINGNISYVVRAFQGMNPLVAASTAIEVMDGLTKQNRESFARVIAGAADRVG